MTTLMSSTNAQLPKISYIKSIDVFLGTCFVMVFGSLLEYAIVGYLGKRISMRKSRSEAQLGKSVMPKTDVEFKQPQPAAMAGGQFPYAAFRNVPPIDPTMYGQPTTGVMNPAGVMNPTGVMNPPGVMNPAAVMNPAVMNPATASSTAMVPYQQHLRSPSFYFPGDPTQPPPGTRSSMPRSPNVPNILIENSNQLNSTTASNPDNEPIYNEHTLHPPSLPSLPSNELQCLPLQPRSHSADNYTHYQQQHFDPRFGPHRYPPSFFAGGKRYDGKYADKYDPKYDDKYETGKYDPKYDSKYDGKYDPKYDSKYDGKYDPRQHPSSKSFLEFNQRLPPFHRADYLPYYYSSLPFQHPAYRAAYGYPPLDGDPYAGPHPFASSNLANYGHAFANPSYHPSMSFANKFTHHYPYSPAFLNAPGSFYNPHYQPFLCYPDYANPKFRQPVSGLTFEKFRALPI